MINFKGSHFEKEIILWGVRWYVAYSIRYRQLKALRHQGLPEKITIDQSGSNTATIKQYNKTHKTTIIIRQSKYLNNMVEQDHKAVKRGVRPMLGFKSFWAACCTIAGIEVMHAIRKGQLETNRNVSQTPAEQFYALAA